MQSLYRLLINDEPLVVSHRVAFGKLDQLAIDPFGWTLPDGKRISRGSEVDNLRTVRGVQQPKPVPLFCTLRNVNDV